MLVSSILIGYRCHQKMPPASDHERCTVRLETRTPARLGSRSFRYCHFALSELDLCGFSVSAGVTAQREPSSTQTPRYILDSFGKQGIVFAAAVFAVVVVAAAVFWLLCFCSGHQTGRRIDEPERQHTTKANLTDRPTDRPTNNSVSPIDRLVLHPTLYTVHHTPKQEYTNTAACHQSTAEEGSQRIDQNASLNDPTTTSTPTTTRTKKTKRRRQRQQQLTNKQTNRQTDKPTTMRNIMRKDRGKKNKVRYLLI